MSKRAADTLGLSVGDRVRIHGLQRAADLNGLEGEIVSCPSEAEERFVVKLQSGVEKLLKPTNIQAYAQEPAVKIAKNNADGRICVGSRVQIHGLTGALDLNGRVGKVVKCPDELLGRYTVELAPNVEKAIKFVNLSLHSVEVVSDPRKTTSPIGAHSLHGMAGKMVDLPGNHGASDTKGEKVRMALEEKRKHQKEKQLLSQDRGDIDTTPSQFEIGSRVRVGGLNRSLELNGQLAVIFAFDKSTARYLVEFENGQGQRRLEGSKLTNMGVATGALAWRARMCAQMNN